MEVNVEKFNLKDMIHRELTRLECRKLELRKEEDKKEDFTVLQRIKSEYRYLAEKIELWEAALNELLNTREEISLLKETVNSFRIGSFNEIGVTTGDGVICGHCPYHTIETVAGKKPATEKAIRKETEPEKEEITLEMAFKDIMDSRITIYHLQTLLMLEQMRLSSGWEYKISGNEVTMTCTYPDRKSEKKMEYKYHFKISRKQDFLWRLHQITRGELEEYDPELMNELYDVRRCVRETPDAARYVYRFMPRVENGEEWRVCKRCGFTVLKTEYGENGTSNENGYVYQCFSHDEDLYSFETSRRANKYIHLAEVIDAVKTYKADIDVAYAIRSYPAADSTLQKDFK